MQELLIYINESYNIHIHFGLDLLLKKNTGVVIELLNYVL